jgi:hypothetical protein
MAEADLDLVIRQIAKAQNKSLMAAVKTRRDQIMARAAKAKDKETRDQFRLIAKSTMLLGTAAAKRLQNSAETPPIVTPGRSGTRLRRPRLRRRRKSLPRRKTSEAAAPRSGCPMGTVNAALE